MNTTTFFLMGDFKDNLVIMDKTGVSLPVYHCKRSNKSLC